MFSLGLVPILARSIRRLAGIQIVEPELRKRAAIKRPCRGKGDAAALAGRQVEGVVGIFAVGLGFDHHEKRKSPSDDVDLDGAVLLDIFVGDGKPRRFQLQRLVGAVDMVPLRRPCRSTR